MRIVIAKVEQEKYTADLHVLIGSPPIGVGKTKEEAVASLMFLLLNPKSNAYLQTVNWDTLSVEYLDDAKYEAELAEIEKEIERVNYEHSCLISKLGNKKRNLMYAHKQTLR